jgi:hypothetical protein
MRSLRHVKGRLSVSNLINTPLQLAMVMSLARSAFNNRPSSRMKGYHYSMEVNLDGV